MENRIPNELAAYLDRRVKATQEEIGSQLHGNWKADLLFHLKQQLQTYGFWQTLIAECDQELAKLLRAFPDPSAGRRDTQGATQEDAREFSWQPGNKMVSWAPPTGKFSIGMPSTSAAAACNSAVVKVSPVAT